jgi:hypothetical protein
MKKSQITIFILLGLLMILALIFLVYMLRLETEKKSEVSITKVSETILGSTAIKYYIITCLDTASKEALNLAGAQSGYIYTSQAAGTAMYLGPPYREYGYYLIPFRLGSRYYDVAYGIYEPELADDLQWHLPPPSYPYLGTLVPNPQVQNALGNFKRSQPDRISSLPALCYTNGSNTFGISTFEWSCESYLPAKTQTVQYYLERYIANRTRQCINLSMLKGYNVTEGTYLNVSVLFGENNVFVTLEYPIVIITQGKEAVTQVLTYTSEQPVRFKKIYELASHIIQQEVKNIFFDFSTPSIASLADCPGLSRTGQKIVRNLHNASCLYPGMQVTQYRDFCARERRCPVKGNFSDVIVIQDSGSLMDQKPFLLFFAVENRAPALDYIDESVPKDSTYNQYLNRTYRLEASSLYQNISSTPGKTKYNVVSEVNKRIQIIPYALDPEEDNLNYAYSGWKTPVKIFNLTGGEYYYNSKSGGTTKKVEGTNVSGGDGTLNYWQDSDYYRTGYLPGFVHGKDAEYPTSSALLLTEADVGYHWVRVNVTDNAGYYDWQDIKIQVRCLSDGNKCCDSVADYTYKPSGKRCATCKRCDSLHSCIDYTGDGSEPDCGVCLKCTNGVCMSDNNDPDPGGKCAAIRGPYSRCCNARCSALPPTNPWQYPNRCRQCYEDNPQCIGSLYRYRAKSYGTPCGTSALTYCDGAGRCIDSTNVYVGDNCDEPQCGICQKWQNGMCDSLPDGTNCGSTSMCCQGQCSACVLCTLLLNCGCNSLGNCVYILSYSGPPYSGPTP